MPIDGMAITHLSCHRYRVREAKVVKNVVGAAQVVLSTCHGAGSRQIANMTFDVCIIDEVRRVSPHLICRSG